MTKTNRLIIGIPLCFTLLVLWFAWSAFRTAPPLAAENLRGAGLSISAAIEQLAVADTLPPLRDRMDAIPQLVRYFCARFSAATGARRPIGVSSEAQAFLRLHRWPGNVRELQNVIERGVILARGEITPKELPQEFLEQSASAGASDGLLKHRERETIWKTLQQFKGNRRQAAEALGISLRTLQYRIKELGLHIKEE